MDRMVLEYLHLDEPPLKIHKPDEIGDLQKMVADLTATIDSIKEDVYFLRKIYTAPKKVVSKAKISKEETTMALLNRITRQGKKV